MLYVDNAISWAQFRLKGGWKTILSVGTVFTFVIAGIMVLIYATARTPRDLNEAMTAWTVGLLVLQCILLLIVGAMRVRGSIAADLNSRQIESHRLMPLSPCQAVTGYIAGGMAQLLILALMTFLIGCGACMLGSVPLPVWTLSNALLLGFAIFIWAISTLTAFVGRGLFWVFLILFLVNLLTSGIIVVLVPGMLMLCSPLVGESIFRFGNTVTLAPLTPALGVSLAAEAVIVIMCIRAAARKYADDEALTLPVVPAVAMLAIWLALSFYGIVYRYDIFSERLLRILGDNSGPAVIGSIVSSLIIAMVVMSSVVWSAPRHRKGQGPTPRSGQENILIFLACLLFSCTGIASLVAAYSPRNPAQSYGAIAIACAISLSQTYILMRSFYGRISYPNLLITVFTLTLWAGPMVTDFVYSMATSTSSNPSPSFDFFSSISPIGMMMRIYADDGTPPNNLFGLFWQTIVLAIVCLVAMRLRATGRRAPSPIKPLVLSIAE